MTAAAEQTAKGQLNPGRWTLGRIQQHEQWHARTPLALGARSRATAGRLVPEQPGMG